MIKTDKDIPDIYPPEGRPPEADPVQKMPEMLEREIRKQRFFNLFAGALVVVVLSSLAAAFFANFLSRPEEAAPAEKKPAYLLAYTLPADEQWALAYRPIAFRVDHSAPAGRKAFSVTWIKNTAYHIIMGEQALRLDDPETADNHFETVIKAFPSMHGVRRYLGAVYLKKQYFEKAVERLQQALEEQPSADVLNNLGVAYMGIEEYDQAEAVLQRALQQRPELAGCYKNLAFLYQKTGRTNALVTASEKYLSLNPQDTRQLENYVSYLTSAGRIRDAIGFLDRLEGADPLAFNLLRAKTAAQDNDPEGAVRALREASRFTTPRQMIAELHHAAFDKISKTESFEALTYELELAAVSLSTNLPETRTKQ